MKHEFFFQLIYDKLIIHIELLWTICKCMYLVSVEKYQY